MTDRPILWAPSRARVEATTLARFQRWLKETRGLEFANYPAMWEWSISDLDGFWRAIWEFFDIRAEQTPEVFLAKRAMPGAEWCPGARLNYADQILCNADGREEETALVVVSESFPRKELSWGELRRQVASVAESLRDMGVGKGDRVTAVLPNTDTALIAFLATASIGAIWSLCALDMGHVAVIDRFAQIAPKVLIVQDGYVHAGKTVDRRNAIDEIVAGLPSVEHKVMLPVSGDLPGGWAHWDTLVGRDIPFSSEAVEFDHPIWVVYSSGTTGNPKPIVHGHGGVVLEAAKQSLHQDLSPRDTFTWMTSSGWIMWAVQWVALARGARVALFDHAPNHPDMMAVWRFIAREKLTFFGAGAAFVTASMKAGVTPGGAVDLSALRTFSTTGSPLTADGYAWIYEVVKNDIWLTPISGGTDVAGGFVGGNPMAPVREGEMQARALGVAVRAFDESGNEVFDQVGELVVTEPMPSMPLYFWGDEDGSRFFESYFDTYPGVWRHGDWIEITPEGGSVIYGRSDATINRKGLRMGSSEIYQAVEGLPEIQDSLVVDLEFLGRESFMPLFVVLSPGAVLNDALKAKINEAIRTGVSPRFLPNAIVEIAEVPRTLSGKKLEVPVKKLLLGGDPGKVVNRDSMANPDSFDTFIAYAQADEAHK